MLDVTRWVACKRYAKYAIYSRVTEVIVFLSEIRAANHNFKSYDWEFPGINKISYADEFRYLGGEFLCWMLLGELKRRKFYISSAHSYAGGFRAPRTC